jgi:hypothetical protein
MAAAVRDLGFCVGSFAHSASGKTMLTRDLSATVDGGRGEPREPKQASDSTLPGGPTGDGVAELLRESVETLIIHGWYLP